MQKFNINKVDIIAFNTCYGQKILIHLDIMSLLKEKITYNEAVFLGWRKEKKLLFYKPDEEQKEEVNEARSIIREINNNHEFPKDGVTFFILPSDKCVGSVMHIFEIFRSLNFCHIGDLSTMKIFTKENKTLALIDVEEENG